MNDVRSPSGDTSNDVLFRLEVMHLTDPLNYRIIAQSEGEVGNIQKAPAISMSYFITESSQSKLQTTLSMYSQGGEISDQVRLLNMNDVAFSIWKGMEKGRRLSARNINHHRRPCSCLASPSAINGLQKADASTSTFV